MTMLHRIAPGGRRLAAMLAFFVVIGMLAGCVESNTPVVQGPSPAQAGKQSSEYRLGPGDKVLVTVFGQPDLSGEHVVNGAGNISMALVGAIPAGGATAPELEQRIVNKLHPRYLTNPRVGVQVLSYRPFYIVGEVNKPGSYPYVDGMVVMNAVALAGGFTYRAQTDEFYITHPDDPKRAKVEVGPNAAVEPGDVVTVKERFF
jgi:polysaccharide export outer membrane protein